MRFLLWFGVVVGLVVFQTTIAPLGGFWQTTPDFLLVTVVLMAVYGRGNAVYFLAPVLGYLRDLYSGAVAGCSILILFLLVYFVKNERRRLDFDSYLLDVMVVLATFFGSSFTFFIEHLVSPWGVDWGQASLRIAGQALYNTLLAEALRAAWKGIVEPRILFRPIRRRFREA